VPLATVHDLAEVIDGGVGIFLLECLNRHVDGHMAPHRVIAHRALGVRVPDDRDTVLDARNSDLLIEGCRRSVFSLDTEMADASNNLAVASVRIDAPGVRTVLDVADHPFEGFRGLGVALVVYGDNTN